MVRVSNIVEVWEQGLIDAELVDDELDISMLGDKIYVTTRFIKSLYSGALTEAAQHDNDIMIPVRACGEWGFNKIGEYWKGLTFERAVKVGEQPYGIYYTNCVLLTNLLIILQMGTQTVKYFEENSDCDLTLPLDYFEQYLNAEV